MVAPHNRSPGHSLFCIFAYSSAFHFFTWSSTRELGGFRSRISTWLVWSSPSHHDHHIILWPQSFSLNRCSLLLKQNHPFCLLSVPCPAHALIIGLIVIRLESRSSATCWQKSWVVARQKSRLRRGGGLQIMIRWRHGQRRRNVNSISWLVSALLVYSRLSSVQPILVNFSLHPE